VNFSTHFGNPSSAIAFGLPAILLITKAIFPSLKKAFTLNGVPSVYIYAKSASLPSKNAFAASLSSHKSSINICLDLILSITQACVNLDKCH
jgi:hypothetical protein